MLFVALLTIIFQCPDGSPPPCSRAPRAAAATIDSSSVAVLFLDSRDTAVSYLADGLTEDIATSLGRVARLRVKAPSSVRRAQRTARGDLRSLGRALSVRYLVDGSLRKIGQRYRVAIRLVTAQNEVTAWGNTYDRTAEQLLDLPGEIATAVAGIVGGTLGSGEEAALAARPTAVAAAWDHYLRGKFFFARRTGPWAARALAEFQQATDLDPRFSAAWASMSYAYGTVLYWGWPYRGLSRDSLVTLTHAAAARAVALDSNSSDSWMARAEAQRVADPVGYRGVIESLRRAVAVNPRNADAWHALGTFLRDLGQDSASRIAIQASLAIEPDRPVTLHNMAMLTRDTVEALRWTDSVLAVDPDFEISLWLRSVQLAGLRRFDEARRDIARLERLNTPTHYIATAQATVAAMSGDTAEARRQMRRVAAAFPDTFVPSPVDATVVLIPYVAMGEYEAAVSFLERVRPRGTALWSLFRYPWYDAIRNHPRFQAVMREAKPD